LETPTPPVPAAAKILTVDDNPAALYATSRLLRSAGYEVIEANTGYAALAAAPTADLVVLDINLPDIDGFEVCRRLRASPETATLPVLHLSATFTDNADLAVGLAAGADAYLTRPVERPVLIATVKTLLFAKQADRVRRGSDAKLRTMFELAPVAIAIVNSQYRYESVNPAYCDLTGYQPEELIGRSAGNVRGTGPDALVSAARPKVDSAARWNGQVPFERKDGTVIEVEWKIAEEGISGTRVLVATDITRRLEAESERSRLLASERAARSEAERSNRLKEEFLATLSHELRNPLNAILGWSTVLGRSRGLPESAMQGIHAIERNSKLQAQMIADLLDYAGISFGKMRLVPATIDPYPVVKAAIDVLQSSALAYGVQIKWSCGTEPVRVDADPARLQQIVWNLVSNAIKFSASGGAVIVTATRVDNFFRIVVQDHGKGIAASFLPRIFDRFSQQDATVTRGQGGLGLGLAIVKHLVELHNGSIEAYSAGDDRGAVFTVNLPLSDKEISSLPSDFEQLRARDLTGVTALVVEDDADARELTKRILTDAGAVVIEATSAEAALKSIQTSRVHILISDIGMAEQDGYQLLRTLRAQGLSAQQLPAIALTAFARMQDRNEALAAGFQDHLVKPLDPQMLIAKVAMLRRSSSDQN
jgi:PAS domain S-box-containing protein